MCDLRGPPGNLFGGSFRHNPAPAFPALGAHIDNPVGGLNHVEIVLDRPAWRSSVPRLSVQKPPAVFLISSKCKPVVGSSQMKSVPLLPDCARWAASFTRCASPPESVVADYPNLRYPRPTSSRSFNHIIPDGPSP